MIKFSIYIWIFWLLALFGFATSNSDQGAPLLFQEPEISFFLGSDSKSVAFDLEGEQAVRLSLRQDRVDLVIEIRRPDGTKLLIDAPTREFGDEVVVFVSQEKGRHLVTVGKYVPSTEAIECIIKASVSDARMSERTEAAFWQELSLIRTGKKNPGDFFPNASSYWEKQKNEFRQGMTLVEWGIYLANQGNHEEALTVLAEALPLFSGNDEKELAWMVACQNQIGNAFRKLGRHRLALDHYEQNLEMVEEALWPEEQVRILKSMGETSLDLDFYETALELFNQALTISLEQNFRRNIAACSLALARTYIRIGKPDLALDHIRPAQKIWQELHNVARLGTAAMQEGWIMMQQQKFDEAMILYHQALSLHGQACNDRGIAGTFDRMGTAYRRMGNPNAALDCFAESLKYWQEKGDIVNTAEVMSNIGQTLAEQGKWPAAVRLLEQASGIFQAFDRPSPEARTSFVLAQFNKMQGNHQRALELANWALCLISSSQERFEVATLGRSFTGTRDEYFRFIIDLLMDLHRQNPSKGYHEQAFLLSERNRARFLREALLSSTTLTKKQVGRLQEIGSAISGHIAQRAKVREKHSLKAKDLDQKLRRLMLEQDQIQSVQAADAFSPISIERIQGYLDNETMILSYVFTEERSFVFTIKKNLFDVTELPPRKKIETLAMDVYQLLSRRPNIRIKKALELRSSSLTHHLIQRDLLREKTIRRIVVIPDGALHYVPFSQLPLQESGRYRPLILDFELIRLPSVSFGLLHHQSLNSQPRAAKELAVFADPEFDGKFPGLPSSRKEALSILELVPEEQRLGIFGVDVNREKVFSSHLNRYRYLHFATHFYQDKKVPDLAAIVLSQINKAEEPVNGFLSHTDLASLSLRAECITLSACGTGLGEIVPGDGMWGMSSTLLSRTGGASSRVLVTSLWPVSDQASAQLMRRFYKYMLHEKQTPSAALRSAQIEMTQSTSWHEPYYWAAFVPYGDWKKPTNDKNKPAF